MRYLCFIALAALSAVAAPQSIIDKNPVDPDPRGGWVTLTHGHVKQPNGEIRDLKGLRIPFIVEPAPKSRPKGYQPSSFSFGGQEDVLQTVYMNDRPNVYFASEFDTPSALDDVQTTPSAVGTPWKHLSVGWRIPSRTVPLYIFGAFDNGLGDQGAGNSSFSHILGDTFGFFFTEVFNTTLFPTVPGEYMITFDITGAGLTQTDNQVYFLQQWRQGSDTGPFMMDWAPMFSGGGNPQIGSSADQFWYDSNFDGIYEHAEIDLFNNPPEITGFEANFAMKIEVDTTSTTTDLPPAELLVQRGTLVSGNFLSAWSSNNQFVTVNNVNTSHDSIWPVQTVYKTSAPASTIQSLQLTVESNTTVAGQQQQICMFNYALNTYVVVNTSTTTIADQTINYIQGIGPSQFVRASDQEMKILIRTRNPSGNLSPWQHRTDMVKWRVATN